MPYTIAISNRMAKLLFPIKSLKVIHLKITATLPKGQRVDCHNCFVYRINSCHMCPFLSGLREHQDTCTENIDGVICTIFPLQRVWANCSIQNVVVDQKRTRQKQRQRIFDLGANSIRKMPSYQYSNFHCGDKTILRTSYLHNGISYTDKMASLYWIRALSLPLSV